MNFAVFLKINLYLLLSAARHIIVGFIDFVHKPFARFIPTQTFRYLACGGSNSVLNWALYSWVFVHLMHQRDMPIGNSMVISARVFAWIISFSVTFPVGFVLSRHIVFPESNLHGKVQFFRYALVTVTFILLTYVLIKVFALVLPMVRADISYFFIMAIIAVVSYLSQRFYTFKTKAEESGE
jgi:putative flippase GtrA